MFFYNWQIREEWFVWSEKIPHEELIKKRTGGMGSILHNLYHVIDCEQLWINKMKGTPATRRDINDISSLEEVVAFSELTKPITQLFLESYNSEAENRILQIKSKRGETYSFTNDKILKHIIAHEIHHIGQLSVWSREIEMKPVSSDILMREI
ncbi:MAG TPA: DinB family protein [Bacillaceae bacterium]